MKTKTQHVADLLAAWKREPGNEQHLSQQIAAIVSAVGLLLREVTVTSPTGVTSLALQEMSVSLMAVGTNLDRGNAAACVFDKEMALAAILEAERAMAGWAVLAGVDKDGADAAVAAALDARREDGEPAMLPGLLQALPVGYAPPDLSQFVGEK